MATTNQEAPNTLLSDSTLKILDIIGEGPIAGFAQKNASLPLDPLMSIYFDDIPIRNTDGSYNFNVSGSGFFFDYMSGTPTQSGISGFEKVETIIPLSSNTLISNPAPGAGPYKTVVTSFNTDTYPDADSIKVTIRVPALYAQDDNGNTNGYEMSYAVDIALNNGPYVPQNPLYGAGSSAEITINGKCTVPYLKTLTYQLPKTTPASSSYSWRVRVRRVSQDIQSIRTQNAMFVDSISIISTNGYAYPNTAMGAFRISANQFSSIPSRSYEVLGALLSVPVGYTPTQYGYGQDLTVISASIDISSRNIAVSPNDPATLAGVEVGMLVTAPELAVPTYVNFIDVTGPITYFSIDRDPIATNLSASVSFPISPTTPTITPASYPTIWTGDFRTGVWTDNPAWVFYDLATDPVHGLGDYIQPGSVDKWTLYQIAQYCDEMVDDGAGGLEPRFTCNVAIQQPDQAYSVLLNLASTFRGMMYYANGTIQLSQSTDDKIPVYEFTNANVVDGRFSYSDTAKDTRSTVAMVKWRDPNNGFRESIQYIEDVEGIQRYGYVQKEVSAFACNSPGQAYRLGIWTLQTERLLTETVTFQTSLEGLYLRPGDNFAVYDNFRNNRSQGGRIVGFSTGRSFVDLDRPVTLDPGITYTLTAITPKAVYNGSGSITGSNQIDLIRQSQIETYRVTDTAGTYTRLTMAGQFDSGIYPGSPWILSASGYTGIFDSATFYTCLATAEVEPGKIEVLGLQANTGIQFLVSTGYTVIDTPPNAGDDSSIQPPSNISITYQTGALADNTFYSNLRVNWRDTPDRYRNFAQYEVNGRAFTEAQYTQDFTQSAGITWNLSDSAPTGYYDFRIAAVSVGGVASTFLTGGFLIPATNPFGRSPPLSGVFITENFDDYLFASNGAYTGFVGQNPTVSWNFQQNSQGYDLPQFDLISGYRIRISGFDGTTNYLSSPIIISGRDNSTYTFPTGFLYNSLGGPARRGFQLFVDTIDDYGGISTGGQIKMNNPPPKAPMASGFVGFNGGLTYTVTPQVTDVDVSGIYLWYNQSPSYTPQFGAQNYVSPNLSDIIINDIYQITDYYAWFSLVDTFGYTGCPIYGPVRINPNGSFSGAYYNINQQLTLLAAGYSGVSGYTTGQIYQMNTIIAATGSALAQQVNSVSASVTSLSGYTNGQITTLQQVIVNTGQASVNYSTNLYAQLSGYTTGQIYTTQQLIVSTSGASATYVNNLLVGTTGTTASVQILARAMITGATNGTGGAPIAEWGFKLNANGSVAGMTANITGQAEYGTMNLSGLAIQSAGYTQNVAGWRITPSGNAEFNNLQARGAFTGGVSPALTSIDVDGIKLGTLTAQRIHLQPSNQSIIGYRTDSNYVYSIESTSNDGTLANAYGQMTVWSGSNANARIRGDRLGFMTLGTPTTITAYGDVGSISGRSLIGNNSSLADNLSLPGRIQKLTSDGYTTPLYDGDNTVAWQWDGTYLNTKIDSTVLGPKFSSSSLAGVGGTLSTVSSRFDIRADSTNSLALSTNGTQRWIIGGTDGYLKALSASQIQNLGGGGWTVPLNDGTNTIEFQAVGGQIFGRINGAGSILLG